MEQDSDKPKEALESDIAEYRNALLQADEAAVREYDKTVIYLSGGAIAISFTFLKSVCESGDFFCWGFLLFAWMLWGASVLVVLASHYFSHRAMRRALADLNDNKLNYSKPGGGWDIAINILNPIGGILFVFGLTFFLVFVGCNFYHNDKTNSRLNSEVKLTAPQVVTVTTTTISQEQSKTIQKHHQGDEDDDDDDLMTESSDED